MNTILINVTIIFLKKKKREAPLAVIDYGSENVASNFFQFVVCIVCVAYHLNVEFVDNDNSCSTLIDRFLL